MDPSGEAIIWSAPQMLTCNAAAARATCAVLSASRFRSVAAVGAFRRQHAFDFIQLRPADALAAKHHVFGADDFREIRCSQRKRGLVLQL